MGRTRNKLEVWDGGCRMTTTGDMGRVMEFLPGQRTSTQMRTPMGCMDMDIVTHVYELDVVKEKNHTCRSYWSMISMSVEIHWQRTGWKSVCNRHKESKEKGLSVSDKPF